jgi:hypothetical protein
VVFPVQLQQFPVGFRSRKFRFEYDDDQVFQRLKEEKGGREELKPLDARSRPGHCPGGGKIPGGGA